ncbi:MAG: hypothetical protein ACREK7_04575 [Gemmatimonadota bacterium]
MPCRRRTLALLTILVGAGCASGSLRDAKNAYNRGDFAAAHSSARRLRDDPQARLIAARAGMRMLRVDDDRADSATLAAVAVDLRAAAGSYPFPEEWANRELAAGFADWLMRAGLPELADLYYRAGLEAAGDDPEPAEQALAEGALQAGLETLDRWEPEESERKDRLRDLQRVAEGALDDSGLPYPPGLADQALRVAWHDGRLREAWLVGAAGWLRATAMDDLGAASLLESRLEDLVFPAWREEGERVEAAIRRWEDARRAWLPEAAPSAALAGPAD